tara:strand:+ start:4677 stop:4994 length:318 start_codon:yes stop_codon:yes gene_type:complete
MMGKLSNAKKLTDTEKYAIQGMHDNEMSASDIGKSLSRDIFLVEAYIEEYTKEYAEEPKDTNITKTINGREGVAIMTEATSQRVDEIRKNGKQARERNPALHKIK